jgi:hypothetical protein
MRRIGQMRRVWVGDKYGNVGDRACVTCTPLSIGHPNTPRRGPYISIYLPDPDVFVIFII